VTAQILGAWEEAGGDPSEPTAEEPVETEEDAPPIEQPVEPEEEETPAEEEPVEEEGEEEVPAEEEPAPEEGEEAEPEEAAEEEYDPEIRAFLAKFQGDVGRALRYGVQSQHALSRQGSEKQALERRVRELESELTQANAFTGDAVLLNEAQRNWVTEAIESGNPSLYVRNAVNAGEFGLARAICTEWGHEQPYDALRTSQAVDVAEGNYYATMEAEAQPEVSFSAEQLLGELERHFPDMPKYAAQMTSAIAQLGDLHPLVIDARSQDPEAAVRGVMGIYEIARASTHSLASAKEEVRNGNREKATSAKRKAVVASAAVSPSPGETPSQHRIGPGLTLEQLDEEWARNT